MRRGRGPRRALAGIGFTVSLFITGLAFTSPALQIEAKIGILAGSLIASLGGVILLLRRPEQPADAVAEAGRAT